MNPIQPKLSESWHQLLREEFEKPYFLQLKEFLIQEKKTHEIFPPGKHIFNAFDSTPVDDVSVVILGQDPYHGPGQAHGLSFSVPEGIKPPPSLMNIFKELSTDVGFKIPSHGNLSSWAGQGVLLLNATLTVRSSEAGSHQGKGWETFTDAVIRALAANREYIVFMLWGKYAQSKIPLISTQKHLVLTAPHPSPLSAYQGFWGCKHFSKANQYLTQHGRKEINWQI